jgi:hypothetical protein
VEAYSTLKGLGIMAAAAGREVDPQQNERRHGARALHSLPPVPLQPRLQHMPQLPLWGRGPSSKTKGHTRKHTLLHAPELV